MKNHNIIRNETAFREFIDWLPELQENECYYVHLQARKKYMKELDITEKIQHLKRFTTSKETFFNKVKQLECPIGSYTTKSGVVIPDEAIALYVTLNPRNLRKALFSAAKSMVNLIDKHIINPEMRLNPHGEVLKCVHKAKSRSCFVHFDIDRPTGYEDDNSSPKDDMSTSTIELLVTNIVGKEAVTVVETRGGCHVLVDPNKVEGNKKNWFTEIRKAINIDQSGDIMIPVVGCNQGGFTPRFI